MIKAGAGAGAGRARGRDASAGAAGAGAGAGAVVARRMPRVVVDAHAVAAKLVADARAKAAGIVAEATQERGAIAEQVAHETREKEIARIAAEVDRRARRRRAARRKELDRTIELAVLLAERLVGEAIARRAARIGALALDALKETRGARQMRIEASPATSPRSRRSLARSATESRRSSLARARVAARSSSTPSSAASTRGSHLSWSGSPRRSAKCYERAPRMTDEATDPATRAAEPARRSERADLVLASRRRAPRSRWRLNLVLFLATVASVLRRPVRLLRQRSRWQARSSPARSSSSSSRTSSATTSPRGIHKVDASLPFFIPMPLLSPFGTMGAVIRMRGVIPTRRALLDIGASGPLAGLVLRDPALRLGRRAFARRSVPTSGDGSVQLGESLLMKVLDHFFAPAKPRRA